MPLRHSTLVKLITDIVVVLAVGLPILVFYLRGVPFHRGFFCSDDTIRYPYKDSTVTNVMLYLIGIFLPVITMTANELHKSMQNHQEGYERKRSIFGFSVPPYIWSLYRQIGMFLFGACMSQLLTDIAKFRIGRLRPHFLHVCQPSVDCSNQIDKYIYIANYTCAGDPDKVREARLSFPSGHSSFSAYTMIYLILYLQTRMNLQCSKLLKPFVQFILFVLSWYTALSRVSDFKHHWGDVLAGLLLGASTAIIVANFVSNFFSSQSKNQNDEGTLHNSSANKSDTTIPQLAVQ